MKPHIVKLATIPGQRELWLCKQGITFIGVGYSPVDAYKSWYQCNKSVYGNMK